MNEELIKALINIQSRIGVIPKTKIGQTGNLKFKYADLQQIWKKLQPLLEENKIFFSQQIVTKNGSPFLNSKIFHESGSSMESEIEISHVTKDIKHFGALISYYRRYATVCIFGLVCDEPEIESKDGSNIKIDYKDRKKTNDKIKNEIDEPKISTENINKFLTENDLLPDSKSDKRKFLQEMIDSTSRTEIEIIENIYSNYGKFNSLFEKRKEANLKKHSE